MLVLRLNKIVLPIAVVFVLSINTGAVEASVVDQNDGTFLKTVSAENGDIIGTCTYGGVGAGVSESTDCTIANPFGPGGNTRLEEMVAQELFEIDNWILDDKIDRDDRVGTILGDMFKIMVDPDATTGTWSLLDGAGFPTGESFAIALKAGSQKTGGSVVYLLDTSATAGTWDMIDISGRQLSNITLFGSADPATPIPLPAAGWLLLSAIGGLGFGARRCRKSS